MAIEEPTVVRTAVSRDRADTVESFLLALASRLRLARFVSLACYCLLLSSFLLLAARTSAYFWPLPILMGFFSWTAAISVYVIPMAVAGLICLNTRYDMVQLARFTDDQMGLKDRVASAMSVRLGLMETSFSRRIVADAERSIAVACPKLLVKLGWTWLCAAALVATVLTLAAIFLPISPLSALNQRYNQLIVKENAESSGSAVQGKRINGEGTSVVPVEVSARTKSLQTSARTPAAGQSTAKQEQGIPAGKPSTGNSSTTSQGKAGALQSASAAVNQLIGRLEHPASGASTSNSHGSAGNQSTASQKPGQSASSGRQSDQGANSNVPTLGEKLREFANRLSVRTLTSGEQQQAASSLNDVNHKLDGYQMPLTQGKLSAASQDLNDGQQREGIDDVESAAYYADHEGAVAQPGQSGHGGEPDKNSVAIPLRNPQASGASGQTGQQSPNGSGTGTGGGGSGQPQGPASGGAPNHAQSGYGQGGGTQKPRFGSVRQIDPAKLGSGGVPPPILLPISSPKGRTNETTGLKTGVLSQTPSTVPYLHVQMQYQSSKEQAVDSEQIPPAYKDVVRRYFSAQSPSR